MPPTARKPWTRDELMAAMHLYCLLPFGRLSQHTPEIRELALALDRSPSSVAMKLCNLASLDPAIRESGRSGLEGASRLDREVWAVFQQDWGSAVEESAEHLDGLAVGVPGNTAVTRTIQARRGQDFFREAVLGSYGRACALTGLDHPALLRASHILPWASHEARRLDPSNGLCLNALHDAAFDRFLVTFDEDLRLVLGKDLKDRMTQAEWRIHFVPYEGKSLRLPERFAPDESALAWHRGNTSCKNSHALLNA